MDAVTHMLIGGIAAQLPESSSGPNHISAANTSNEISWRSRAIIGATAAIFPDIDYLLFWVNPLDFLAYWHRAETHSIFLAPLWSLLITFLVLRIMAIKNAKLVFIITLAGILSHIISDSLTVYGTQWFSPITDFQVSWNLLFVVDPYFTTSVILSGIFLYLWRRTRFQRLALIFPLIYLLSIVGIKQQLYSQVENNLATQNQLPSTFNLLPQPFSPLYWQALSKNETHLYQSYLKLADDSIATRVTDIVGFDNYGQYFNQATNPNWNQLDNLDSLQEPKISVAWNHSKFKAFRDFSHYPVFLQQTQSINETCYWFSDLRYHWPGITPSFRYAMCHNESNNWQVRRLKYFSDESQGL